MRKIFFAGCTYQIRQAAGTYWLINMDQEGVPYHKPIQINETGAMILSELENGKSEDEIVAFLAQKYSVSEDDVKEDVAAFFEMLHNHLK